MANGNGDKIIDNNITLWVARIVLPTIIVLVGTIFGFGMNKVYNVLEEHGITLNKVSSSVDLLSQQMILRSQKRDLEIDNLKGTEKNIKDKVNDHESRIRTLEHPR